MKRFSLYIIILYSMFLVASCHDEVVTPPVDPAPQPRAEVERTVIVYMAADNTLSDAVRGDTTEMAKGKSMIPDDTNFILFLDDRQNKPAIYELSRERGMQLWKQYGEELCSTDSPTMLAVLREIESYFPARHYGITFWSHATGWAPERKSSRRNTFGQDKDPSSGTQEMEIPALRDVLAQLPRFDYIFFDACFMQCIEVAYELRNATDYMIGSPAEIPGPGAPYDKIMEALCRGDVQGIVQGYAASYPYGVYPGVLLSCINCSKLDGLAQATGRFLTPLYMGRSERSTIGFQLYCTTFEKYTFCFDMRTTMYSLLSDEDYAAWQTAFDEAVPVSLRLLPSTNRWFANHVSPRDLAVVAKPEHYGGVSMFVPLNRYNSCGWNEDFQKTAWYAATGWQATGW